MPRSLPAAIQPSQTSTIPQENFVTRIDAPLLSDGELAFYDGPIFDTPRVPQFIHRTEMFM